MTAKTILLIDDMPEDRDLIASLVSSVKLDWTVQATATGSEGLSQFRKATPDCVLLDNRLEAEDGLNILPEFKELDRFCPVIMLTGTNSDTIAIEAIRRGASDFLVKTEMSSAALVTTIDNAILRASLEHRLARHQIEHQRQQDHLHQLEKALDEMRSMSSAGSTTSVTRGISGAGAIRDRSAATFAGLARGYLELMDDYIEQLVVKAPKPIQGMKAIVQEIGKLSGGPRDLLDVHLTALEAATIGVTPTRSEAYSVEGRLLALEMMGLLVDYYRTGLGHRPDRRD